MATPATLGLVWGTCHFYKQDIVHLLPKIKPYMSNSTSIFSIYILHTWKETIEVPVFPIIKFWARKDIVVKNKVKCFAFFFFYKSMLFKKLLVEFTN